MALKANIEKAVKREIGRAKIGIRIKGREPTFHPNSKIARGIETISILARSSFEASPFAWSIASKLVESI